MVWFRGAIRSGTVFITPPFADSEARLPDGPLIF